MTSANDGPVEPLALIEDRIAIDQGVIGRRSCAFEVKISRRHASDTATSVSAYC